MSIIFNIIGVLVLIVLGILLLIGLFWLVDKLCDLTIDGGAKRAIIRAYKRFRKEA